ncbi:MAG: carbonic anhydrase family protein [Burkholderiales bacterium]|nr:carbonic anhydrase family protein [Burkholderiales bacterium]
MERLRLRLSERLAAPGAAPVSGTLDLQVGTRTASPGAARAPAKGSDAAAHAGGAPARPAHDIAQDIGRGHAEGIAWSRPPGGAPAHRVSAQAAPVAAAAHASLTAPAAHAAPPAQAAHTAHAVAPGARRPSGAAKGHAGGAHAQWAYEGAAGPTAWGALKPEFGLCANGQRQSPIDIRGGLAVDLEPVKFDYRPSAFSVIDNGHTVQVNLPPGNAIEVGGRRYELVQFHFHRPSEERIDGRQFEMSLHLVHKDPTGRLAVVGVLLGKGPAHPAVQTVWNNLPLEKNEEAPARAQIDPGHLLPEDRRYYTYMGSLTTPPCSEGVQWVVMRTPVTVTAQQVELFARIYPMNARPAQPVAGRRIMQSE